jgi:glycosyltransferase involved in cell wall biosynthesis
MNPFPHILFVTGEYPPMEGGVGAYTFELAKALRNQGARVSVLTGVAASGPAAADITVYPVVERWRPAIWRSVPELAREIGADWIHVQYQTAAFGMNPAINFAPQRWRRALGDGIGLAWTYHDLLLPYLFPKAGDRLRRWVTERPLHTADLTIVTNQADYMALVPKAGDRAKRLVKIPIGSNITGVELTPDERASRRASLGYGPDDIVLAYFGFLNRSKGGLTLIRAVHRLAEDRDAIRLLMIGERVGASDPTNYAYLQEVEALIRELGLEDRVRWTGRLSDQEVATALNACDVLLMPYEDGASLRRGTLMAGLANGCAIVTTTPQTPTPELVDERDLMYAAPGNDKALAIVTNRLLSLPALAAKLRRNARERSRLFSWEGIGERHLEIYRKLRIED